jgi:hypothetical protein
LDGTQLGDLSTEVTSSSRLKANSSTGLDKKIVSYLTSGSWFGVRGTGVAADRRWLFTFRGTDELQVEASRWMNDEYVRVEGLTAVTKAPQVDPGTIELEFTLPSPLGAVTLRLYSLKVGTPKNDKTLLDNMCWVEGEEEWIFLFNVDAWKQDCPSGLSEAQKLKQDMRRMCRAATKLVDTPAADRGALATQLPTAFDMPGWESEARAVVAGKKVYAGGSIKPGPHLPPGPDAQPKKSAMKQPKPEREHAQRRKQRRDTAPK